MTFFWVENRSKNGSKPVSKNRTRFFIPFWPSELVKNDHFLVKKWSFLVSPFWPKNLFFDTLFLATQISVFHDTQILMLFN